MARSRTGSHEHVAAACRLRLRAGATPSVPPVLELEGECDLNNVPEIDRFLRRRLGPLYHRQHLVIDLGATTFVDSSFIGFLVSLVKSQRAVSKELVLTRPHGQVRRALALVGLQNVVPVLGSVEEAVGLFRDGGLPVIPPVLSVAEG